MDPEEREILPKISDRDRDHDKYREKDDRRDPYREDPRFRRRDEEMDMPPYP